MFSLPEKLCITPEFRVYAPVYEIIFAFGVLSTALTAHLKLKDDDRSTSQSLSRIFPRYLMWQTFRLWKMAQVESRKKPDINIIFPSSGLINRAEIEEKEMGGLGLKPNQRVELSAVR